MGNPAVSAARRTGAWMALLALTAAAPAWASGGRDDCAPCTRHARAEYQAEHERSRQLGHLDCAGLTAFTEHERQLFNQRTLSRFFGPTGTAARPASSPRLAPRATTAPEPKPGPDAVPRPDTRLIPPDAPAPAPMPPR